MLHAKVNMFEIQKPDTMLEQKFSASPVADFARVVSSASRRDISHERALKPPDIHFKEVINPTLY
jgi:hypothetical protein